MSYRRSAVDSDFGMSRMVLPLLVNLNPTELLAIACDIMTSTIFAFSVAGRL